jgi:hypothetical protein
MRITTGTYNWRGEELPNESLLSRAEDHEQGLRTWKIEEYTMLLAVSDGTKVCWFLRITLGEGPYWAMPWLTKQIDKHEARMLLVGTGVCLIKE